MSKVKTVRKSILTTMVVIAAVAVVGLAVIDSGIATPAQALMKARLPYPEEVIRSPSSSTVGPNLGNPYDGTTTSGHIVICSGVC
jgi:hypothetical protein